MEKGKAIRLPSSKEILFRCDGDFFDNPFISLLGEGHEKKLKRNDRIIITYKDLPKNFNGDFPSESDLILKERTIKYGDLKDAYLKWEGREYSPEVEQERSNFEMAVMEKQAQRRGAWAGYTQITNHIKAVEEYKEERMLIYTGNKKGLEKLKEKQDKRGMGLLQIC